MVDTNSLNYTNKTTNVPHDLVDYQGNAVTSNASGTATTNFTNAALGGASNASNKISMPNCSIWVDYIFLDTDERRRFAQLSHEYLIEQLQFTGSDTVTQSSDTNLKSLRMNFNHPCKELIWVVKSTDNTAAYWNNFSDCPNGVGNDYVISRNPVLRAKVQLNGNDRFDDREGVYFSRVQPYQHHENVPSIFHQGINVYSFGIKPEEHQPSGTLNMSRIDTAVLSLSSAVNGNIMIFTQNYNVLRILSGMGGLAYSN